MQNQVAAYQLLNKLSEQIKQAANTLHECYTTYQEVSKLLQVDQTVATAGLNQIAVDPVEMATSSQGCTFDLALWAKPNSYQGTLKIKDSMTGKEMDLRAVLFQSKPNDKSLVLNGFIVKKDNNDINDNRGGIFVYHRGGNFELSATINATDYNNKLDFSGTLADQRQTKTNPNAPDLKLKGAIPVPMFTEAALKSLGVEAQPAQSPAAGNLFNNAEDLLASSSAPADPQPQPKTPESLFSTVDNTSVLQSTQNIEDLLS
jgi:hypothetical protein